MSINDSVIYGINPVEQLIATRADHIDRIYFSDDAPTRAGRLFELLKACRKKRLPYQVVPVVKLEALAKTAKHQGVAAVCSAKKFTTADEAFEILTHSDHTPLALVAASIEDPGNLGAIIRSCVALNVDVLFIEKKNTTPLNATAAKTSAGMVEHINISKPNNLEGLLKSLKENGFLIVGADCAEGAKRCDTVDMRGPMVLITGGEDRGIPPYLAKLCDALITIPLSPKTPSLNVSAAASILLYEISRQRGFYKM